MPQVKILESRGFPSARPERRGQTDRLIIFEVDGKETQRYFVTLPSASPSEAEIQAAIKEELARRQGHVGKSFSV